MTTYNERVDQELAQLDRAPFFDRNLTSIPLQLTTPTTTRMMSDLNTIRFIQFKLSLAKGKAYV
jgi:hypothetical protein